MVDYSGMTKEELIRELNRKDNIIANLKATPETKTIVKEKMEDLKKKKNKILKRKAEILKYRLPDQEKQFIFEGYNRHLQKIEDKINKLNKILS